MTRYFLLFFAFFLTTSLLAQLDLSKEPITKITYLVSYNGQTDTSQNPIWALASNNKVLVTSRDQMLGKSNYPREMMLVMPVQKIYSQYAFLNDSESVYMTDSSSIGKQQFEFSEETKQILGHTCKKAKTVINSNTIELWYTTNAGFNAAPGLLGQSLGLVLQQVRNGNTVITATDISKQNIQLPDYMTKAVSHKYNKLDYTDLLWRSRFTTIPLFDNQQINFSDTFTAREGILRFANGTIVLRKVKFPVLSATSQIFLDLSERSTGDAYDRTGTVFLIAQDKKQSFLDGLQQGASVLPSYENGNGKKYQGVITTDSYSPAAELMRFFTPFGVGHFNDRLTLKDKIWHNSVPYRQEITDFAPLLSGREAYIGVFIGNYDKGGHTISANITIHQDDELKLPARKAIPLFNTLNIMEMAGQEYGTMFSNEEGLKFNFRLDKPLKNATLRYITTGHGGWGNGDEFQQKKNTILLDGKTIFDLIPWREDCGSYRLFNPVSGNFPNGLSSSDYSRSNWCPGTVTNPYIISIGDINAGSHTIQVKIPQGAPEGTSFSAWNVSGVLIGEE